MKFQIWANSIRGLICFGFAAKFVLTFDLSNYNIDPALPRRRKTSIAVAVSYSEYSPLLFDAEERKREVIGLARTNNYAEGIEQIHDLLAMAEIANGSSRYELAGIIEDTIGSFCRLAFSKPYRGRTARRRVDVGLEALQLQFRSEVLPSPYNHVQRDIVLGALRSLTAVISYDKDGTGIPTSDRVSTKMIFRILQRLLSGVGIRDGKILGNKGLSEKDFNFVLNALANSGRMDVAHKVVALQERTASAPMLSPVTYSILLKGYGKLRDVESVRTIVQKAEQNNVHPDVVMLNSILNAFINCNECGEAEKIFHRTLARKDKQLLNLRTYNTMLKGLAQTGELHKAKDLTKVMRREKQWDPITTNTLVNAAVRAKEFEYAESILECHTEQETDHEAESKQRKNHPNVEAYTSLIDGYAKNGNLEGAFATFKHMREIHVHPNEYTYTCIISACATQKRMGQALRILDHMEGSGIAPTSVTYNALFSSLVRIGQNEQIFENSNVDSIPRNSEYIDQAVELFQRMVKKGVRPTVKTISILLHCFATCSEARISEATAIVSRLEADGVIPKNHAKVNTAMIKVYGAADDVEGALAVFRRIKEPDVIAVNAFLDAACRCGKTTVAFETFKFLFGSSKTRLLPDVITFSILLSSQLRLNSSIGSQKAQATYKDMKDRGIAPDIPLVDMILSAIIRNGRSKLRKKDVLFTLGVLKDAEKLKWMSGELEQRKQSVRELLLGKMSEIMEGTSNDNLFEINAELEDELFWKKGWNKVDSGFRLWGQGGGSISANKSSKEKKLEPVDTFLASKGWNNVESGFRLI